MPVFNNDIRESAGVGQGGLKQSFKKLWNFVFPSAQNVDKTITANKEMAEYQYQKDLAMWHLNNKYNAPEAQMERLRQAGLNPALVYGDKGVSGNTTSQLPKYNAPNIQYAYESPAPIFGSLLNMYQDFQLKQQQADNLKATEKNILQDTMNKGLRNKWLDETHFWRVAGEQSRNISLNWREQQDKMQRDQYEAGMPYQLEWLSGRNKIQTQQLDNMLSNMKKMDAETEYLNKQNEWYLTKLFSQIGLDAMGKIAQFFPAGRALSMFKGTTKQSKDSILPWNTTLKTNPIKINPRSRRVPSPGVVNP